MSVQPHDILNLQNQVNELKLQISAPSSVPSSSPIKQQSSVDVSQLVAVQKQQSADMSQLMDNVQAALASLHGSIQHQDSSIIDINVSLKTAYDNISNLVGRIDALEARVAAAEESEQITQADVADLKAAASSVASSVITSGRRKPAAKEIDVTTQEDHETDVTEDHAVVDEDFSVDVDTHAAAASVRGAAKKPKSRK